jgi:hypothetical protein
MRRTTTCQRRRPGSTALDDLITEFLAERQSFICHFYDGYRQLKTLEAAIHHEARSHIDPRDPKKHDHQYRVPLAVLAKAERRLQHQTSKLAAAATFEDLYKVVDSAIGSIMGIGKLTVYDITQRIGTFLGKHPRLVYLHAGTRIGARRLGFKGETIDPRDMPPAFARLSAAEIEDFLCICKDEL